MPGTAIPPVPRARFRQLCMVAYAVLQACRSNARTCYVTEKGEPILYPGQETDYEKLEKAIHAISDGVEASAFCMRFCAMHYEINKIENGKYCDFREGVYYPIAVAMDVAADSPMFNVDGKYHAPGYLYLVRKEVDDLTG